jgi:hypothetical protein
MPATWSVHLILLDVVILISYGVMHYFSILMLHSLAWIQPRLPLRTSHYVIKPFSYIFFCFSFLGWGWDWVRLLRRPLIDLLHHPRMIDDECGAVSGEWELAGETEVLWENMPQYHLSTTNPTWPNLGSSPGRRDGKLATNRLSYGTA